MTAVWLRLLGGGLLTLAGAMLGREKYSEMRRRLHCLRSLCRGLGRLSAELTALQTPLPQLFFALREENAMFATVSAQFGSRPLQTLWREAAAAMPMAAEDAAALSALGGILGRYDAQRQAAETEIVRARLSAAADALEREIESRGRRFAGLGAALGAMAAVLLF